MPLAAQYLQRRQRLRLQTMVRTKEPAITRLPQVLSSLLLLKLQLQNRLQRLTLLRRRMLCYRWERI